MEAVTGTVRYPQQRAEVLGALADLSDAERQRRVWLAAPRPGDGLDGLDVVVHVLFDDTGAATNPGALVGEVLYDDEVAPLARLGASLGALVDELGDVPDARYLDDPRWPQVVAEARLAWQAMSSR